jgi:hypothetical protein
MVKKKKRNMGHVLVIGSFSYGYENGQESLPSKRQRFKDNNGEGSRIAALAKAANRRRRRKNLGQGCNSAAMTFAVFEPLPFPRQ